MLGVPGVAALGRLFTNTSVPLITQASSEQSICFAVPDAASQSVQSLGKPLRWSLAREISTASDLCRSGHPTVVGLG
jgi:hypothetical protein